LPLQQLPGNISTVDLDFHQMGSLQLEWKKFWLGVSNETVNFAELGNMLEVNLLLAIFIRLHFWLEPF